MSKKWLVDRMAGKEPKSLEIHDYIAAFCYATLPIHFTMLAFGKNPDWIEVQIFVAGLVAVGFTWALNALSWRSWKKNRQEWENRLPDDDPQ